MARPCLSSGQLGAWSHHAGRNAQRSHTHARRAAPGAPPATVCACAV